MKIMKISYFLLSMVVFTISMPLSKKENQSFKLGEEVSIPFDSLATLNDKGTILVFQFADLIEESRCPPGATCIWAGRATIELKVDKARSFTLSHGDLFRRNEIPLTETATYLDYKIYLKGVSYNQKTDYRKKGKYFITINVEKEKTSTKP